MGIFVVWGGVNAWMRPNSNLARWLIGSNGLNPARFLAPIIGLVFVGVGAWQFDTGLQCKAYADLPHVLQVPWVWSSTMWFFVAAGLAFGIWGAIGSKPIWRELQVLSTTCFTIAGGESTMASGVYAHRWFTIAIVSIMVGYGPSVIVAIRGASSDADAVKPQSSPDRVSS
jgi:hypothetical protein